jgi:DNA invertase Pin-like site-specific DNA recombinase
MNAATVKFVAYYRVSTAKQGRSGLGLEAQRDAVAAFVAARGGVILAPYTETESGKRDDRPELAKAMAQARALGATLLIAKLDRLSRDAHFLIGLQKAGVDFAAVDMPEATNFTVGIMALVAQWEREAISKRTKEGLAVARRRVAVEGQRKRPDIKRLGNPNGARAMAGKFAKGQALAAFAVREQSDARAADIAPVLAELAARGIVSANAKAAALNASNVPTPRGGKWTARSVLNVMHRAA